MSVLFRLAAPVLHLLDPERAHGLTIRALKWGFAPKARADDARLACQRFGLTFPNPVGIAAGFDKNGEVPDAILRMGCGFAEVGTVTPRPQMGNPKPRLFRLHDDQAVINRMGFNNAGLDALIARLEARRRNPGIVGGNLGANKDSDDRIKDYVTGLSRLYGLVDYFVINISSPNTPGLRGLQDRASLEDLLSRLCATRAALAGEKTPTPLLLKVAPDLDSQAREDIAAIVMAHHLDGMIISNTTIGLRDQLRSKHGNEAGGLSGAPLMPMATEVLADFYRLTGGAIPLIGVGGIASGADAYAKICHGASLLQLYSALTFQGPDLITRIKEDLLSALDRDGFASLDDAIGSALV